jgi:CBS domain containing-hemolysin-like protein
MSTTIYLLAALALVALNAFFVATEFAIVKVRATRIEELAARGVKRAVATREVVRDLNAYLAACQLGITLASLGLGWVGEPAFAHLVEPLFSWLGGGRTIAAHTLAVTVAFVLITVLHVVLGEVVPKTIAVDRAVPTALAVAWPIRGFYRAFYPAIWAMNELSIVIVRAMGLKPVTDEARAHSGEELRMIVARSRKGGVFSESQARLLQRALDFADRSVRQIMLPRGDIVYIDVNRTYEENIRTARESGHTRYPVCEGDLDNVIGVLHIKDMFVHAEAVSDQRDLRALAREPMFVPESLAIDKLLTDFRKQRLHMGIVIDEHGGVSGLVTLEDVLEELTGEIQDEFDEEEPKVRRLADGRVSVDATLAIDELERQLGIPEIPEDEIDTLGGLVLSRLGRMARVGDAVELGGRSVRVSRVRGRRILRLVVEPLPADEAATADSAPPDRVSR